MSDSSSSASSSVSDFEDYVSSVSDSDEERFEVHIPSLMVIYGKSMCGKSTFVYDLIAGEHFKPKPELFYLLIPVTGIEDADKDKMKEFVSTVNDVYNPFSKHPEAITVVHTCEDLNLKLSKADKDIPKLVFIDDMLTEKLFNGIFTIVNEVMHRSNALVIITTQMLFLRNARALKENSTTLVVFSGQGEVSLKKFFSDYPEKVRAHILNNLGDQRDEEWDVEGIKSKCKPVIIEKLDDQNKVKIWKDIHDIYPVEISILKENNASMSNSDQQVRRLLLDKQ